MWPVYVIYPIFRCTFTFFYNFSFVPVLSQSCNRLEPVIMYEFIVSFLAYPSISTARFTLLFKVTINRQLWGNFSGITSVTNYDEHLHNMGTCSCHERETTMLRMSHRRLSDELKNLSSYHVPEAFFRLLHALKYQITCKQATLLLYYVPFSPI